MERSNARTGAGFGPPPFSGEKHGTDMSDRDRGGTMADVFVRVLMHGCVWLAAAVAGFLALLSAVPTASAAFTQPTGPMCSTGPCDAAWCGSSGYDAYCASVGMSFHHVQISPPNAVCIWVDGSGTQSNACAGSIHYEAYTTAATTPTGATCTGGSCTCNPGYSESGSTCVSGCTGDTQRLTYFAGYDPGLIGRATVRSFPNTIYPEALVTGGCAYQINAAASVDFACYSYSGAPTKIYCDANYTASGAAPVGGEATPSTPSASDPCPSGQNMGVINGIPRCFSSSSVPPPVPQTTTTVNATPVVNGDGTTTYVATTTAPNGATDVVTTIKDTASGAQVSQSTVRTMAEVPKSDLDKFCVDNPQSPLCKITSFSGTCGATLTCDGDAIQCAVARATFASNCQLSTTSSLSALGDSLAAGNDPLASTLPSSTNFTTVNVSGMLDTTDALGGGSGCLSDQTFDFVGGQTYTLPWSQLCGSFELMGFAMMFAAALGCARIVGIWG